MKKLVYILAMVFLVACSSDYDSEMFTIEKKSDQPTKKDSTKTDEPQKVGLWGTVVSKSLNPLPEKSVEGRQMWRSTIRLQKADESIVELAIEFPVTYSLTGPAKVTTEDQDQTKFMAMPNSQAEYGPWAGNAEGDTLRTVTTEREVRFSHFTHSLKTSHVEAYTVINGKREAFKTSVETSYYKSLDRSEKEVERNDSIFLQETCTDNIEVTYNGQIYKTSCTTIVERFLKIKKTETPTEEEIPTADLSVDKLVNATALVASPRFNSAGSAITSWHKTSLVETETSYFIWVDGQFIREVAKSTLKGTKYNAAMLDGNVWIPCLCTTDGKGGWTYSVVFADGSYKTQTIDQRLAVNSGLKSFTENNTAAQTPFIKTVFEKKAYNGKSWWRVTGYNVDGKTTISYTVAEK